MIRDCCLFFPLSLKKMQGLGLSEGERRTGPDSEVHEKYLSKPWDLGDYGDAIVPKNTTPPFTDPWAPVDYPESSVIRHYTQIHARAFDAVGNDALRYSNQVPMYVYKPEDDVDTEEYTSFTLDSLNATIARATLAKHNHRLGASAVRDKEVSLATRDKEDLLQFPTESDQIERDLKFAGISQGYRPEDDRTGSIMSVDVHEFRVQVWGEANNLPNYWVTDELRVGNSVGFALRKTNLNHLGLHGISDSVYIRNPALRALPVLQWMPWNDSEDYGGIPPPNVVEGTYSGMGLDIPTEPVYTEAEVGRRMMLHGDVYRAALVQPIGIIKTVNGISSHEDVKNALVHHTGHIELLKREAKVDIHLDFRHPF